ncbi:MAG TPA: 2TM domain-containing protein [Thermomicrobiales bacterium]|nr:2TM domain-containing protein [Thermomicrobiales bacterium]
MPDSKLGSHTSIHQRAVRGFYLHAAAFAIVNLILLVVNLRKSPGYLWIKWVLLDWGVGLATHAWIVFHSTEKRPEQPR